MKQRKRPERELSPYQKKLLDPRWQKKRLEILQRDNWTCRRCASSDKTLAVHHRVYLDDLEPWEAPNNTLETLCETCHADESQYGKEAERRFITTLRGLGLPWWAFYAIGEELMKFFPPMKTDRAIEFCAYINAFLPHISEQMGFMPPDETAND